MSARITGTLEQIVFYNEENQFTIGKLSLSKGETVAVLGKLPGVQCGETLELSGEWVEDRSHGKQFKIESFQSRLPSTVHGIKKYLGSGLIHNIGPKFAEKIVEKFGSDTLKVISEQSGRLLEIPGIGEQRARSIKAAWEEQSAMRGVLSFLHQYGVGAGLCSKLIRQYGNEAETVLRRDPYRVAREVNGIGFKTADKIALNLGFANDSLARLQAGILFALEELEAEGHTAVEEVVLKTNASEFLGCIPRELDSPVEKLIAEGSLSVIQGAMPKDRLLQLPVTSGAEVKIAHALTELYRTPSALPAIEVEKAILWAMERAGFEFAPQQHEGLRCALSSKIAIITGGPGTGKTTLLKALVDILKVKKVPLILAAPTGRAAQRLGESSGEKAYTLHRLILKAKNRFRNKGDSEEVPNPMETLPHLKEARFVIIDEASMIDTFLAADFLQCMDPQSHLLLVGDVNQLPSVGPGNFLSDVMAFG